MRSHDGVIIATDLGRIKSSVRWSWVVEGELLIWLEVKLEEVARDWEFPFSLAAEASTNQGQGLGDIDFYH